MSKNVFLRKEIKYLITERERELFEANYSSFVEPDEYGRSTICNIYYDTPDYRLIRNSLDHPVYKEKLRMRSYGQVRDDDFVFLELKKKYKGIVYKRRIQLPEKNAFEYNGSETVTDQPQISMEIQRFWDFYKTLKPMMYISYKRTAYFSKEDRNLRITFDDCIMYRLSRLRLTESTEGISIIPGGTYLMEIKAATGLPRWLLDYLNLNELRNISFSKYGTAYLNNLNSIRRYDV